MWLSRSEIKEMALFKKLRHYTGKGIAEFSMIQEGDRIAVAVSGGKDSLTMLILLDELRKRAPVKFEILAVTIDSGYNGFRADRIREFVESQEIACHIEKTEHFEIITQKRRPGSSYCSICARLKRGVLYGTASRLGCNKLALGHHSDDFIETLLLNQFFVGSLKAMSACMLADNGEITVIRPLVYAAEADIRQFSQECSLPVISCSCPVCDTADLQRKRMKKLLQDLQSEIPHIKNSMLKALSNVHPRHLLDDRLKVPPASPFNTLPDDRR